MASAVININVAGLPRVKNFINHVSRIADQTTDPIARADLRIALYELLVTG